MIEEKNKGKFSFVMDNGLTATTNAEAKVYVHFTDNGSGKHAVNGKVISKEGAKLGWIRTNELLPSNTPNLIEACHLIILEQLLIQNPGLQFEIL